MYRNADWMPFEIVQDDQRSSCRIGYHIRCAACGRALCVGTLQYQDGTTRTYCSLTALWHRNAIGMYRRSKRAPRRKYEYTLPDGGKMAANLNTLIEPSERDGYTTMPFVMECDGKMLLDGRYVPCKERNLVDPFTATAVAEREVLLTA